MISRRHFLSGLAVAAWPQSRTATDARRNRYQRWVFPARGDIAGVRHEVWSADPPTGPGPSVIVLHEISGASDLFFAYTDELVAHGFSVHCPVMFGSAFVHATKLQTAMYTLKACWPTSEFECRKLSAESAINAWLIALAVDIARQRGGRLGAIGMCLTGIQPLAMLRSRAVVAPVLCQPTLPLGGGARQHDLGLTAADADFALARVHDERLKVLLIRYEHDSISSAPRVARLKRLLEPYVQFVPLPGHHHSSLVHDPHPTAKAAVVEFLRERLIRS